MTEEFGGAVLRITYNCRLRKFKCLHINQVFYTCPRPIPDTFHTPLLSYINLTTQEMLKCYYLPNGTAGDTRMEVSALHITQLPYIGKFLNNGINSFVILRVLIFQLTAVPVRVLSLIMRNIVIF